MTSKPFFFSLPPPRFKRNESTSNDTGLYSGTTSVMNVSQRPFIFKLCVIYGKLVSALSV
jgi:hypothetical protein